MKTNFFTQNLRATFTSMILLTMGISFSSCCSKNWYKNGEQDDVYAAIRPTECDVYVSVRNDDDDYIQYQEAPVVVDEPYTPTIYTPPATVYVPPPIFIPRPAPVFIPRQNPPVYNESTNNWGNTGNTTNGNPKGTWTSTANPNGGGNGVYNNGTNNGYNGSNNNGANGYYNNGVYYYYPRIPRQRIALKDNTRSGGAVIPNVTTNVATSGSAGQGGNDATTGGSSLYNAEVKEKTRIQERRERSTIYNNTSENKNENTSRRGNNSNNNSGNSNNSSNTNSSNNTYKRTPSTTGEQRGTSTPRTGEGRTRTPR